jgi:hypothetical protein
MSTTVAQYEFTQDQNKEIAGLAGKMRFVGLFSVLFGLVALAITLLCVLFIFRDRVPAGFRAKAAEYYQKAKAKLPEDLQKEAEEYAVEKIPTDNNFLTGVAIFCGVTGVIFLLQGGWVRSSASSFQLIVDTRGNDITNLMNSLTSLRAMYGMLSLLLGTALLAGVVATGLTVYKYVAQH